jgi:hypothetical protein
MLLNFRENVFDRSKIAFMISVLRVAVRATQMTAARAHENRGKSGPRAFALNAEEDLIDFNIGRPGNGPLSVHKA